MWQLKADSLVITSPETTFGLQSVDFSNDKSTSNNSKFAIKIVCFGPNSTGTSGNDRFDNITVKGIALSSQDYPTLSVSSDKTSVCSNSKITFTAKTTNAGASPTFQWIKNNVNVGTNKNTFVDSSFQDQDVVYCKLTVSDSSLTSNKITITVASSNLSITSLTKNAPSACGNNNDGDITINKSGGTSPFQYSLNNVNYVTSNSFTNLGAGTYTAYVKDAKGCTASLTDVLSKIPALTITVSKTSPSACSSNNGSITINNSGGNSPFKYSLNNTNYLSTNVFSNLAAGKYTAYVKDADDCIASATVVLANASALIITSLDKTSPSGCNNNDGTIKINNSGGTSPFKYSLDNVSYVSGNTFNSLAAGTYTAYVKDAQGCTASFTDSLSNNSSLVVTDLSPVSPTSCITNDGSITINTSGGSSPFQYSLDSVKYFSESTFNNLGAGTYTGYVRDNRGCTASLTDVINQYSSSLEIDGLIKTSASACRNDGSINIKVNEGYLPFQYSLNNVNYASNNLFTNLSAGTYTAYVKDAKGCIDSISDVLDKVQPIVVSLTKTPTTACSSDGTITINNTGGNSPFKYSLDNVTYSRDSVFNDLAAGAYTSYVKDKDGCIDSLSDVLTKIPIGITLSTTPASACSDDGSITISNSGGASPYLYSLNNVDYLSTSVFTNLAAGRYTGYVKDDNGCIDSLSAEVTRPSAVAITGLDKTSSSGCNDDGSITINSSGGKSPYRYSINGVDYFPSNVFNNLAAGAYTAYVKDANNCIASVTDQLAGASPLIITSLSKTPPACSNNGSITINYSGGTSPYQYSLDNSSYVSGNTFNNLAAGTYTAYIKDAKGCTATFADSLVGSPSLVIAGLSKTSPVCNNDGSITINNSGGTSPYQYSLDNAAYVSGNTFTNLAAGDYTAYVKDANGCTASLSDVLTGPSPLAITSLTKTSPSCINDGKITINKTGGTSLYQYSLDNVSYVSGNTFTNLGAGNYTAYIKDANGCTASFNDVLAGSPPLTITGLSKTNPSACSNDGKITINKTGGTSPYLYSLDDVKYVSSNVFTNLAAGSYMAYVKDAKGCKASLNAVLTSSSSTLVITSLSNTSASACNTGGAITINTSGGTSPYQYSLNNVNYFSSNQFTNLAGGKYTAYVKDAKGCIASLTDTLSKAASIVISLSKTNPSACANTGVITINKTGGTSPFTYSLNNGNYVLTNVFKNLAAGKYKTYVKDAKGCIASDSVVLTKPAAIVLMLDKTNPSACANNGVIKINKTGGTSPFTYSLDNVKYVSNNVFSNLAAGTYKAYTKDANGCIASTSGTLTKPAALVISSVTKVNPSACSANGKITINRTGGTSPYQYSLDSIHYFSSNVFSNLKAGTYTAYVKDAKGCKAKLTKITLTAPACTIVRSADRKSSAYSTTLSIKVFPNPSIDQFSIIVESSDDREVEVIVTDLLGRKIISTRTAPNNVLKFGKELMTGMYIVEALQGKGTATLKIVKNK